jgi:hypothetical protein
MDDVEFELGEGDLPALEFGLGSDVCKEPFEG